MKIHPLVFVFWFPIWILILAITFRVAPDGHSVLSLIFKLSSLSLILFARDAIWKVFQTAEFWLVAFSLLLTFGMLEFALRSTNIPWIQSFLYEESYFKPEEWIYTQHHYNLFAFNPDFIGHGGDDFANSYGYRGPEVDINPSEDTFRIITLGGSTTAGLAQLVWDEAYPAQLQEVLNDNYGLESVEVINGGHGGYSSWESLINFEFRALDLSPDMIIIYQNTNDVQARIVNPETYRGDNSGMRVSPNFSASAFTDNWALKIPSVLSRLILVSTGLAGQASSNLDHYVSNSCAGFWATEECLGVTPMDALAQNPPIYYQRNIEHIISIAQSHDIEVVLMSWAYNTQTPIPGDFVKLDYFQSAFDEHNGIMRQIAEDFSVPLFDFAPVMSDDLVYWLDGSHMSAEGNRVRAELLAEFLVSENLIP